MRLSVATGLLAVVVIAGCAAPYSGQDASTGSRPASAPSRPIFATQLAGPATFLAPMPTAVVLLTSGDLNRNRAFCTAFTSRLPTAQAALATSPVAPNLVLTRWLVQLQAIPVDRATDCDFLVGTYDYARAGRLLKAVRLSEGQLSGPGPFLLMVVPDSTGIHVVGLDGSARNDAEFGRFIDEWGGALRETQDQITRTPDQPGLVKSIFNLVSAIFRTAAGGAVGLIRGVVAGL